MNNFRISRIYIENFKLISDKLLLEDLSSDLVMLDGPNGFGKTSVFDAIEIAMTGNLFRVFSNDIVPSGQGADDNLYLNDQNRELRIAVEFKGDDSTKTILVHGSPASNLNKRQKKANNPDYFQRYELDSFDDYASDIADLNLLQQNSINEWFSSSDLLRYFKLYHYIQQEETTFFLKMKENERMGHLSFLFDTVKEDAELEKLNGKLKEVTDAIESASVKSREKIEELGTIEQISNRPDKLEIEYKDLFTNLEYSPEWNLESLKDLSQKNDEDETLRDIYKSEVLALIDFIDEFEVNIDQFNRTNYNSKIKSFTRNSDLLENVFYTAHFISELEDIKETYRLQKKRKLFLKQLERDTLLKRIESVDFEEIFTELNLNDQLDELEVSVQKILALKKKEGELSSIVRDFDETRTQILELFEDILKQETKLNKDECPLCGFEWPNGYDELLKEIEAKKVKISTLISDTSKEISSLFEEFYKAYIEDIVKSLNDYFNIPENNISEKLIELISIDSNQINQVTKFIDWTKENKIDISESISKTRNPEELEIEDPGENLREVLNSFIKEINESYEHSKFNSKYAEVFDRNKDLLEEINLQDLRSKLDYIDQEYYKGNQVKKESLNKDIKLLNLQSIALSESKTKIEEIIRNYISLLHDHRISITKRIELPFFIYSGKILQNFEKGPGIFIQFKQSSRTENLKFTQGVDTSHDVLFSMSSGQLSALVISFTLAMNRVFDNSNFGTLLIDDPVQTMDEVNMASLVEILKTDFAHKQLILSTHEDDVSDFMRFKFYINTRTTKSINLKNIQYQISQAG